MIFKVTQHLNGHKEDSLVLLIKLLASRWPSASNSGSGLAVSFVSRSMWLGDVLRQGPSVSAHW